MIKYLTELLGRPVVEPDGGRVGRVVDVIASPGGRLPTITALFVRAGRGERWIPVEAAEIAPTGVRLRQPWNSVAAYTAQSEDLRLQRDILDKQIVDVHDYRVVRVNDVRLADCSDKLCLIGADASFRAIARRLGIGAPIEALARLVRACRVSS